MTTERITQLFKDSDKITAKELYPYYQEMYQLILKKDFEKIDFILKNIDIKKSTVLLLVALLRSNFMIKEHLKYWNPLLENTEKELNNRNLDTKNILQGLI